MSMETYLAYLAVVGLFFASPPGPSQILIVSVGLRVGPRRAAYTMAGDLSANALQMTVAAFGLAAVVQTSATALAVVKWAGVAYLVFLGVKALLSKGPRGGTAAAVPVGKLYRLGFLTSAANPKAVVFFAALFPQFIDPAAPIWSQLLILGLTYLIVDGCLLMLYANAASRIAGRVAGPLRAGLDRIAGGFMLVAALLLAVRGAR